MMKYQVFNPFCDTQCKYITG